MRNIMKHCDDCGCRVYDGACTNCNEILFIADQHREFDTLKDCSEEFKNEVEKHEGKVAKKLSLSGY